MAMLAARIKTCHCASCLIYLSLVRLSWQWDIRGAVAPPLLPLLWDAPQWTLHCPVWAGVLLEHPLCLVLRLRPGEAPQPALCRAEYVFAITLPFVCLGEASIQEDRALFRSHSLVTFIRLETC